MTWVLIIGSFLAIASYPNKDACLAAGKEQAHWTAVCVPMPDGARISMTPGGRR